MRQVSRTAWAGLLLLLVFAAGCSIGAPSTFTLNSASVDSTYDCPAGAADATYNVHAKVDVRNGTSSSVTIKSVAAVMTLAAVEGSWLEPIGDRYEASSVTFSPATIGAGSSASLQVTIPSACTNGKAPTAATVYGEYSVALTVVTTAGTHIISTRNRHRIVAASGTRT